MAPLSNHQGYVLTRVATKWGLSVDLQRLIWGDVTKSYYLRGSVTERAAMLLQKYWRRLRAIFRIPDVWVNQDEGPHADRYFAADEARTAYGG
jgi:hypothetical protein